MADKRQEPKRLNRSVGVGEAASRALDPALRKRGFASRDIITHWAAMAPKPYDAMARPDRLVWPRGARGTEGATLYVRCAPGHALGLSHEAQAVAAAVNRYFGYLLVGSVRLSVEPFNPGSGEKVQPRPKLAEPARVKVETAVEGIEDEAVKQALRELGHAVLGRNRG